MAYNRKGPKQKGTVTRGRVKIRGHSRAPRGPDKGKKRVRVPAHQRRKPRL
jgi:hypothetical protein